MIKVNPLDELHLTKTEYRVFEVLFKNAKRVVRNSELMEAAWGQNDEGRASEVKLYISRLRKKTTTLGRIELVRGIGYKFIS